MGRANSTPPPGPVPVDREPFWKRDPFVPPGYVRLVDQGEKDNQPIYKLCGYTTSDDDLDKAHPAKLVG